MTQFLDYLSNYQLIKEDCGMEFDCSQGLYKVKCHSR